MSEIPTKPRRKKLDVPIHGTGENRNRTERKVREKNGILEREDNQNHKISRRHLSRENARLSKENEEIQIKFNELEELSVRKILKLKEKVSALQNLNESMTSENDYFKNQIQELLQSLEEYKSQLELKKHCKRCEEYQMRLDNLESHHETLRKDKKELDEDLNMLKTVVYRLNFQLERYQEQLRKMKPQKSSQMDLSVMEVQDPSIFSKIHQDHTHTPISWGKVNVHTLGPLLDAYQDTITEKDEIIHCYEIEISNFSGRLKEVLKENESLHKMLTEDDECSAKLKMEVEKLNMEIANLKDQNDVLIKKCALKQDKLEEVLKCYEHKGKNEL